MNSYLLQFCLVIGIDIALFCSMFNSVITYRYTLIEKLIREKKMELGHYKKIEPSRIAHDFLILQHASLKCILEQTYDELIIVTIYDKFIAPNI